MSMLLHALSGDPEIEALLDDRAILAAILRVEAALAEALAEAGLISDTAALAIVSGIASYEPDWSDLAAGMARDGVVIPALVGQLRSAIGHPHGADVHRGATSQDIVDTALMVQLRAILPILTDRAAQIEAAIAELGGRWGSHQLMAHTRMQAALPFTVADKLRTWSEPLVRHRLALAAMQTELLAVQLGGPIGDRSTFEGRGDAIAEAMGRRLDLVSAPPWHSDRDRVVLLGSRLSALCGTLGKLGADVTLLAQTEVGAITISGAGASSAMAHKANPVGAEVLVALARHAAALAGTLHQSMVHENERSGAAWTLEWLTLPPLVVATAASLRTALTLCADIEFKPSPPLGN